MPLGTEWVNGLKKKKGKKEKRKTINHIVEHIAECHQHQARPVQIDRYPLRNHKPFSSALLVYSLLNSTYLLLHAKSSSCMGAGNTRSGSPSQQGYRDVGLHERVHIPPDSRKACWTIIQPQHPANLNAAAPSFQSKIRSGSARLWHSACSLSLPRSQSRKCSLSETVSEDHPRSTSRRDGINQATWDEHHNVQKTSLSREHERVFGLRVGNSSTRNWQHKDELNERSLELAIMTRSADKSAKNEENREF